jgi:nucleotide-binding universal stress UspA family protein
MHDMDRPIVVGTDGSESATKALIEAMRLAKALDEPLHIVSAYRKSALRVDVPSEFVGSVNSLDHVESVLADAGSRARSAGLDVTTHPVEGDPADAIVEVAVQVDADILVVGNRGLNSLKRFVIGSVPSKIAHSSPCTTHIVYSA